MTLTEAIEFFGGKSNLAKAVGIRLPSLYGWPEKLTPRLQDRVIAAALREGKSIPAHWLERKEKPE
ncbi:hypothetical protein [Sulfurivirga sp.]|uniref:hypothetical protein n=1 Tax=Sulfurivirga sp. TaxID=2614236 RepID=UPI0025E00CF1|nr:hypothetical protein [Sulfurivirga sp.]